MLTDNPSLSLKEKYGGTEVQHYYIKLPSYNHIVRLAPKPDHLKPIHCVANFFREVFLPQGYPDSVSDDYFTYQLYDTIQAFCSRITGTLTTKAILKSVGVGDVNATPVAAAITWIFKDGTGMAGSILFAWWKGTEFDYDCKKWRLFADILNDVAMLFEMLLPQISTYSMVLLCLTTVMKACVGISGSATRAAITMHQARNGNMADVSAKDASQETAVNLLASVFAVMILTVFSHEKYDWALFILFATMHLLANYKAVKCLRFNTLNKTRFLILLKGYFHREHVSRPEAINRNEPVILGLGINEYNFCGFRINMGVSIQTVAKVPYSLLRRIFEIYKNEKYIIMSNLRERTIEVLLLKGDTPEVIIGAYFHAVFLALIISKNRKYPLYQYEQGQFCLNYFCQDLETKLKSLPWRDQETTILDIHKSVNEYIDIQHLLQFLRTAGWSTTKHSISNNAWRLDLDK